MYVRGATGLLLISFDTIIGFIVFYRLVILIGYEANLNMLSMCIRLLNVSLSSNRKNYTILKTKILCIDNDFCCNVICIASKQV